MSLNSLVNEVIIECLQHLDFRSLLAFAQTCKGYNSLVRESTTLQCIVELAASGCLLAPGNRLSMDLLERVRRHTEAWRALSFTSQKSVFTSWVYCHGSVCCQIRYNDEVLRSQTNMTFYQAPAVHRGVPEETWELSWASPPDYSIIGIAFDPAQDLLVIVAINDDEIACATILSLRSGLPHDDFGQGEAMTLGPLDRYINIEVVDNVLTFTDDRSETTTFDIRTRKVTLLPTLLLSDPWPSSDPWASISTILLSPRHFLGARKNGDGMFLSVSRSISDESSDYVGCNLALPNFFEPTGFHIAEITLLPSLSSVTLGTGAFVDDPAERIIHLRFYPVRGDRWEGEEPRCVDIYILEKTLLLHLPPSAESSKERTLSWEEWRGEDNCMIVESPADFCEGGVCDNSVCGARAVRLSHNTPRRPRALEVLDFHPIRVACAGRDVEVVRETILPGRYLCNSQPLATRLPYTVAKYVLPEDPQGNGRAVITENAVIFYPLLAINVLDPSREIMMFCI